MTARRQIKAILPAKSRTLFSTPGHAGRSLCCRR
ncbi:hypothetical protein EPYR_02607 [Erwinia pyrifoliae DSM 12163]|nr:hypothetical protein EPYR_02607 [Erwinia pyrifoliae DSM 12163]